MTEVSIENRRIVLNSRPEGMPTPDNFRLETVPVTPLEDGQVLLRSLYLSLDPYMRGRMSDAASYAPSVGIGEVMAGQVVAQVEASRHPGYQVGERVLASTGWQEYAAINAEGLTKLDPELTRPSLALGVLGMPGFTAYVGLLVLGQPKAGETVVVAAASGAVGAVVGQIAKLKGCRIVGVAGGPEKCRYVVEELGFDACVDHHSASFKQDLADACSNGIDVYFESVGGHVFDAVLPLLNMHARIPVCGTIALYSATALPEGPDRTSVLVRAILVKRLKMQGFIIFDHYEQHFDEFFKQMSLWLAEGKIKFREDVVKGLEHTPQAFIGLLKGKNFGKLVVQLDND